VDDHAPALAGSADVISLPPVVVAAHHDADGQVRRTVGGLSVCDPIASGATFHAVAVADGALDVTRLPPPSMPTQSWSLGHAIAVSGL